MPNKQEIRVKQTGAEKAKSGIKGVDRSIKGLTTSALAYTAAAATIVGVTKKAIDAYKVQAQAEAQLNAVISSTGGAAKMTATEMKGMAGELQKLTSVGDEAIINAQALMLTFTNIGRDVFPEAIETVIDMSAAMGTDLKSSVIQLGKALNDPITGISALSRVGVQLTDEQKTQIKSFVKLGDTVSAQRIILGELETQFGGVAEAMAAPTLGMDQLHLSAGDLMEQIGSGLTPTLNKLAAAFAKLIQAPTEAGSITDIDGLKALDAEYDALAATMTALTESDFDTKKGEQDFQRIVEIQKELARIEQLRDGLLQAQAISMAELEVLERARVQSTDEFTESVDALNDALEIPNLDYTIANFVKLEQPVERVFGTVNKLKKAWAENGEVMMENGLMSIAMSGDMESASRSLAQQYIVEGVFAVAKSAMESLPFGLNIIGAGIAAVAAGAIFQNNVPSVKAATELDEVYTRPQLIYVGDQSGEGGERVRVTHEGGREESSGMTLIFNGNITDKQYVRDYLIPEIEKAGRLNA